MLSSGVHNIDVVLECKEQFEDSFNKSKKFDSANLYFMMLIYWWLIPKNYYLTEFVHKILGILEYLPEDERMIGNIDLVTRTKILRKYFAKDDISRFSKSSSRLTKDIFQQFGWW